MVHHCDMRFPGGRDRALTFSYDDGVKGDIHLLELFKTYGVKGTFNLNSGRFRPESGDYPPKMNRRLSESEAVALFADAPEAEVACHSLTHGFLDRMDPAAAMYETLEDRRRLEKRFGRIVRGMAYPFGTYNDRVVEVLRLAGIDYCRGVKSSLGFDIPQDWLRLQPTCHHGNPQLMELAEKFLSPFAGGPPRLFYVWGHAYEFDDGDNWYIMEKLLARVAGHENVWYATNGEIFAYCKAYESLVWSADMSRVHNPSALDVYLSQNDVLLCVPAGQCVAAPVEWLL
ncbi:MAG: polysaccharide deacetylase family protein [Clostridia bacterium]|nr:polysaccharide deacetylase family protein [Clostridia bacterium]